MSDTKGGPLYTIGCFPTMITLFCEDGSLDVVGMHGFVNWLIESGCTGLFTNCWSSEMYHLTNEERIQLVGCVKAAAKGRVPVVACGTFQGSLSEKASFIRALHPHCDAVVIITNQMVNQDESDDVFLERVKKLVNDTPDVPLGFYECPDPYRRVLSPRILQWAVSTGRFVFFKDTCSNLQLIDQKLLAIRQQHQQHPHQPILRLYNANVETLLASCLIGASGYSGISANFFPWLQVFLIESAHSPRWSSSPELQNKVNQVQQFLSLVETLLADGYPRNAKFYLKHHHNQKVSTYVKRANNAYRLTEIQKTRLVDLYGLQKELCERLGIKEIPLVINSSSAL